MMYAMCPPSVGRGRQCFGFSVVLWPASAWPCVDSPFSCFFFFIQLSSWLDDTHWWANGSSGSHLDAMATPGWEQSPYVSPSLLVERERRCLRQSLVLPSPDLTWRVIVLDVLLQLIVLAVSQWHLVVDCLKAAKEMHSMKYCCFALVLRAVTHNEGGGKRMRSLPEASWNLVGSRYGPACVQTTFVPWPSQSFLLTSS